MSTTITRCFSAATRRALGRKGIKIMAPVALPDMTSSMPFANATRGYSVNDNGCGRVWTLQQILEAAR
jgi:hypothetical protein